MYVSQTCRQCRLPVQSPLQYTCGTVSYVLQEYEKNTHKNKIGKKIKGYIIYKSLLKLGNKMLQTTF